MSRWTKIALSLVLIITIERFCHKQTEGFRLYKIHSTLTFNPEWEVAALSDEKMKEIETLLSEPFYYLSSGGESYAFLSKDKGSVLKVFKHHHMRKNHFLDKIPLPSFLASFRKKWINTRKLRLNRYFTSCKIAYDHLKEETGLLYLHLNKTPNWNKTLTIYDPIGIAQKIELGDLEFALQKRAAIAYPTLHELLKEKKIETAKTCLKSLLQLIEKRAQLKIADHDPKSRNFGFIDNQAIEIDLGSFTYDETLSNENIRKRAILHQGLKIRSWIKRKHPELLDFYNEALSQMLQPGEN